jgi:hypothetical protein
MKREIMVNVRMNPQEYQQLAGVRKLMDRTTGDALRVLVRRAALELGVTASGQNDRKSEASSQLQAA